MHYMLMLHYVCYAVCTVWLQIVLTGCEGQVLAYSITVDDTAQTAQRALATALKALSQTEPMPALSCPDCAQPASTIQAKAAPGNSNMQQLAQTCVQRLSDPNWGQKVQLKLLCQVSRSLSSLQTVCLSMKPGTY